MIRSNLYDYSNAYIPVCGTITITGAGADDPAQQVDERNNGEIFKNCALFTDFISEINNTQIDNTKDIDVGMPIYNLVEYYNNYSQISESLWQYYRDTSTAVLLNNKSFKSKIRITRKNPAADNVKDVKISIPLKYLSTFWRTFEIPLINCKINLILTYSENFAAFSATGVTKFAITDTTLYAHVIKSSPQDNIKLSKQLESGFKTIINWNKYHSKVTEQAQNRNLYYLIYQSFLIFDILVVLLFEHRTDREVHKWYFLPKVENWWTKLCWSKLSNKIW